jgi:3-hydroxyacyl-[acyl-carrier-protein] dehydratase
MRRAAKRVFMAQRLWVVRQKANATSGVFVSLVGLSRDKNVTMLQAVLDAIPHRPPFLFLDRIDEVRADGATCTRTFRADEPFFAGHYPGNPITPGVLLCEAVFQASAVFLTKKLQADGGVSAGKTPVLCRIEEAKFKGMVKPGDTVSIDVKLVETLQQFHFMTGTVRRDGKAVLTIRFALALVDPPA